MSDAPGDALWTWSLAVYADPAVKRALLAAQNQFGAHVPLLLWAAHAAHAGRSVTPEDARSARAALAPLSAHVRALRDARRHLPQIAQGLPAGPLDAAVAHIAEAEIALEQLELARLAERPIGRGEGDRGERLRSNCAAALRAAGIDLAKIEARKALDALAASLAPHFTR